jgi:hypothetical protein
MYVERFFQSRRNHYICTYLHLNNLAEKRQCFVSMTTGTVLKTFHLSPGCKLKQRNSKGSKSDPRAAIILGKFFRFVLRYFLHPRKMCSLEELRKFTK